MPMRPQLRRRSVLWLLFASLGILLLTAHVFRTPWTAATERVRPAYAYTYKGRDFPSAWQLPPFPTVRLFHEDGVHYDLDTDIGIAEWNATLPSGGSTLYLGPHGRPFTLSMFHQLRCLNIIREILVDFYMHTSPDASFKNPAMAEHCMNYLRQMVLCRGDLRLESVRAASGPHLTLQDIPHTCSDWTQVYDAAEKNYGDFLSHAPEL